MEKRIVLFDGVCNLCNQAVTFIIKRDSKDAFRFASLDSDVGKKLLHQYKIDPNKIDSIILIQEGQAYIKASAALRIAKNLRPPVSWLFCFKVLPLWLTNGVYDFIARNRYRWFGKRDSCMIPTKDLKSKFLD